MVNRDAIDAVHQRLQGIGLALWQTRKNVIDAIKLLAWHTQLCRFVVSRVEWLRFIASPHATQDNNIIHVMCNCGE